MYGAILGDIIGSPYEFGSVNGKVFPLFDYASNFTDDTVMTIAIEDVLPDYYLAGDKALQQAMIKSMQEWGRKYFDVGYGNRFYSWLHSSDPQPYNSFGNGAAARVSSIGWMFDSIDAVRHYAKLCAEVSHNHPNGIKGAEAIASAVFLARVGNNKPNIKWYIKHEFGYNIDRSVQEVKKLNYDHAETAEDTVPEAFIAFFEGENFEDVIRNAVSIGGDCDTIACMAGAIADAYFDVPSSFKTFCLNKLPPNMLSVIQKFSAIRSQKLEQRR